MEFVDIAGLVAGASKGEGLGNQFLAHIRETDAIAHVVRCFADDAVAHVAGRVSPAEDIDVIDVELAARRPCKQQIASTSGTAASPMRAARKRRRWWRCWSACGRAWTSASP